MNDIFSSLLIPHMYMYQLLLIKAILSSDMWMVMVFNATFTNISVILVEKTTDLPQITV